jgi:hypothetical protein
MTTEDLQKKQKRQAFIENELNVIKKAMDGKQWTMLGESQKNRVVEKQKSLLDEYDVLEKEIANHIKESKPDREPLVVLGKSYINGKKTVIVGNIGQWDVEKKAYPVTGDDFSCFDNELQELPEETPEQKKAYERIIKDAGVNKKQAVSLLEYFGSYDAIKKAKKADLARIPGIGDGGAKKILNSFKELKRQEDESLKSLPKTSKTMSAEEVEQYLASKSDKAKKKIQFIIQK